MHYLLAIDQGTSSTRAMIYNLDGELISTSNLPLTQYYPHPGWVEHDPEEIYQKQYKSFVMLFQALISRQLLLVD